LSEAAKQSMINDKAHEEDLQRLEAKYTQDRKVSFIDAFLEKQSKPK